MNKIDLNGRTAWSPAAPGLARDRRAFCRFRCEGRDLGFRPAVRGKTAKEIGYAVSAFKVDVCDLAAVEATRDATLKAFGKIDILVNNAGIGGSTRRCGRPTSTNGER